MNTTFEFNFEDWARLARESPEEFENRRRDVIDTFIAACPKNQRRLAGLQFRIDMERKLAHTPLKACLRVSGMMWDSFLELRSELAELGSQASTRRLPPHLELVPTGEPHQATHPEAGRPGLDLPSATVLNFVRKDAGGTEKLD